MLKTGPLHNLTEPNMILITGATGFVGTGLIRELSNRQLAHRPISRNRSDGFYAIGNIDGMTDWSDALVGITTVVHLAARVHVMKESATDPLSAFRSANADATLNLARQSAKAGVRRFIFLSSIKVNGETTDNRSAFTADDIADPHDPYGQSKHEAEQALLTLARISDMKVTIIRPPLIYGPGVKANFAALLKLAHSRLPLPIGGIDNKRSLVFLGNLIDFIICCVGSEKAANQIFLVSDNEDVSTSELVRRLGHEMNVKPRLIPVPRGLIETVAKLAGKGAITNRLFGSLQVDIQKSCELLDWSPPYSLSEGLRITVAA